MNTDKHTDNRAIVFVDGQNLFHAAKAAYGYRYPNYDVSALSREICERQGWNLTQVRFYTGVPDAKQHPKWNHFWTQKTIAMRRRGVYVYTRSLRYRERKVTLESGVKHTIRTHAEKGIDIRIALDVISLANRKAYDVVLIVSQDQDFSEVADEIRNIAREQKRWIKIASAFPPSRTSQRGINKTDWIRIDKSLYDQCLDRRDYWRTLVKS